MSFREFAKSVAATYFVVVTLIQFATYLLGKMYLPDQLLTNDSLLSPLIFGLLGVLPTFVMYSKKELTTGQFILRKALQLVCIEAAILLFGLGVKLLSTDDMSLMLSLALSVLVIFVLVHVIMYLLDMGQARQLNKDLEEFQRQHAEHQE